MLIVNKSEKFVYFNLKLKIIKIGSIISMKGSKNVITTLSTLEESKVDINSSKFIIPSALKLGSPLNKNRNP